MHRLPRLLDHTDLPLAELGAARLDGELFRVDSCFVVADLPESPADRAQALDRIAPRPFVAELETAAWLHGALIDPPARHTFAVDTAARRRPPTGSRIRVREVSLRDPDLCSVGVRIATGPVRTALDLARRGTPWTPEIRLAATALLRDARIGLDECTRLLDEPRGRGGRQQGRQLASRRLSAVISW